MATANMEKICLLNVAFMFHYCASAAESAKYTSSHRHSMIGITNSVMATQHINLNNTKLRLTTTANSYTQYTLPIYQSSIISIQPTLSKDFTHSTNVSPKSHSILPQTPTPKNPHTPSSKKPGETQSIMHKIGLIIGVVSGLVILSCCLIVFHKKEARVGCLKLLCKPCTKNYSRYNIVPIYVYDDNEQDIRELQDDSDLPLV